MHPYHIIACTSTPSSFDRSLTLKLLDAAVHLTRDQRQRHNTRDVHLRPEDVHVEAQLLADRLDVLETLLVVRAGTTDPDLYLVLDKEGCDFAEGADDAFEGACDLRDVSGRGFGWARRDDVRW